MSNKVTCHNFACSFWEDDVCTANDLIISSSGACLNIEGRTDESLELEEE